MQQFLPLFLNRKGDGNFKKNYGPISLMGYALFLEIHLRTYEASNEPSQSEFIRRKILYEILLVNERNYERRRNKQSHSIGYFGL